MDQPETAAQKMPDVDAMRVLQRVASASETGAALVRAALAEERLEVLTTAPPPNRAARRAKAPAKKAAKRPSKRKK